MKVINMMGPPCSHKSTVAAGLFYQMKVRHCSVELVTEFAKDIVWEGHWKLLDDQLYVFAEQHRRLARLKGKVDFVITDSPLLLSAFYMPTGYPESFQELVIDMFHEYQNKVYFLNRVGAYDTEGRAHMKEEADKMAPAMKRFMRKYGIPFTVLDGDVNAPAYILKDILSTN